MSDTITMSGNLRASTAQITISINNIEIALAGNIYSQGQIIVGNTAENIPMAEVTTPGLAYFRNVGTTNTVEIGKDNTGFDPFLECGVDGEGHFTRLAATVTAPQAQATAATTILEYLIFDRVL